MSGLPKLDESDPRLMAIVERSLVEAGFGPPATRVGFGDLCGLFVWTDPKANVPDRVVDDAIREAQIVAARIQLAARCAASVRGRAVVAAHLVDSGDYAAAAVELGVAAETVDVLVEMTTGEAGR